MHGPPRPVHSEDVTSPVDDLVELPTYTPAAVYRDPRARVKRRVAKRATLLDRLVSTAHVDRVTIDLTELQADLDRLRK